jgi:arsenate reductase
VTIVEHLGFDAADFRSKSWDEFAKPGAPALDFVFTVCDDAAGEVCPVWPGQPMSAHWGIPDPAAAQGAPAEIALAFAEACRQLRNRISLFVELPVVSLDRTSLQTRLHDIGKTADIDQTVG